VPWFWHFKSGESDGFYVEDKECECGRPKLVENAELEALLHEDLCQTQEELAESLGVAQ